MFKKKTNVFFHKYNLTKTKIRFVSASRVTNARITIKKMTIPSHTIPPQKRCCTNDKIFSYYISEIIISGPTGT